MRALILTSLLVLSALPAVAGDLQVGKYDDHIYYQYQDDDGNRLIWSDDQSYVKYRRGGNDGEGKDQASDDDPRVRLFDSDDVLKVKGAANLALPKYGSDGEDQGDGEDGNKGREKYRKWLAGLSKDDWSDEVFKAIAGSDKLSDDDKNATLKLGLGLNPQSSGIFTVAPDTAPEPDSALLLGMALAGLALGQMRRSRRSA